MSRPETFGMTLMTVEYCKSIKNNNHNSQYIIYSFNVQIIPVIFDLSLAHFTFDLVSLFLKSLSLR